MNLCVAGYILMYCTQKCIQDVIHTQENKMTPKFPEVKFNKNGYEIRTDILAMAKDLALQDFQAKFQGWEITSRRIDANQIVTEVAMPEFPGLEDILKTAEKMYDFVNKSNNTRT